MHTMAIDHAEPRQTGFTHEKRTGLNAARLDTSAACVGSMSVVGPLSILLVLVGAGMQGYANGAIDAIFVAFLLLLTGIVAVRLVFPRGKAEKRAFLLTYGVCAFVGGLVQCYSLATFGNLQSTGDAHRFFSTIFEKPPYYSWEDLCSLWIDGHPASFGAPLAAAIWQAVYGLRLTLGFDYGLYVGVMFNALVMGLTGSVTVRTARELFGDDPWRLRRVGTLFAICGLFILFGTILLRGCFITFFNALAVWGLVRWLCRSTSRNLLFASILTGISTGAIMYLRSRTIVIFGLFWFLTLTCWFLAKRLNLARLFASVLVMFALLLGSGHLIKYVQLFRDLQFKNIEKYERIMEVGHGEDSIGMRLVVHQPLPIRLVLGTGSLMVHPIPLWAHFYSGQDEYHLLKGYHGIYQVLVLPLVFTGFLMAIRAFRKNRKQAIPLLFLAAYLSMGTLAVVATSLEQRHLAQFMPAMMILAAIPDTREKKTCKTVRDIATGWFAVVVLVHMAWAIVVMGR